MEKLVITTNVPGLRAPFKLCYRMKGRFAKAILRKRYEQVMLSGLKLKPGDLIQSCDAFNHRIKSIELDYAPASHYYKKGNKGIFLRDITIFDDEGRMHNWGSCCSAPWPPEKIENYFRENLLNENLVKRQKDSGWWTEKDDLLRDRLLNNLPICDKNGCKVF